MQKIFGLFFLLVFYAAPASAEVMGGADAIRAITSFLKTSESLRMTSSVQFGPEFSDCEMILLNFADSLEISVGRIGKFSVKIGVTEYEDYTAEKSENKAIFRNARGVELSLERRIPSRSPDGSEISVTLSDNGNALIHCLVVR